MFESLVRDRVLTILDAALPPTVDPVLLRALESARDGIVEGSFFRVLEAHKRSGDSPHNDLIEQVNQVRKYRNWVAHGRRGKQPDVVAPRAAYERLRAFLTLLGLA
ncbi:MAG TPA: hypothetical protein VG122_01850 [Gemmata sp.]|nr:hypothetical protein [Gemmata sp.]